MILLIVAVGMFLAGSACGGLLTFLITAVGEEKANNYAAREAEFYQQFGLAKVRDPRNPSR